MASSRLKQILRKISACARLMTVMFLLVFDGKYCIASPVPDISNGHLSLPNRERGFERFFGIGLAFPYPYFQRPKYRYPVYDRAGRGRLLYGYGGPETFQYKVFTPIEGHH